MTERLSFNDPKSTIGNHQSIQSPLPLRPRTFWDYVAQTISDLLSVTKILLSPRMELWLVHVMVSLAEFKVQAAALPVEQRASLASFLLHWLPDPDYNVSDEDVAERVRQTKSGEIQTISLDELRKGLFAERRR